MDPGFTGIARLAHNAPTLLAKHTAEYRQLPAFHILNRCESPRLPFEWTINPYRGCEFGCRYCYARYTHEFMEFPDPHQFESLIFAKQFHPAEFRTQLRKMDPCGRIALGTATDPYQPAERRYGITRSILEILNEFSGRLVGITTKSNLITRDLDLLRDISSRNTLMVNLTITTLDTELARKLEPLAPRPDLRIDTVRRLAAAGIPSGVFYCPVMPLINDREEQLDAVARAAAAAGARWLFANLLFLTDAPRKVFFAFLEEHFPGLAGPYRACYGSRTYLRGPYAERLAERLKRIRSRHGLTGRTPQWAPPETQLSLAL